MQPSTQTEKLIRVTKQRNILLVANITLILSIVLLSITLLRQEKTTVVVPGYTGNQFSVSTKGVSREYLELVSKDIIFTMLNITPYNHEYIRERMLTLVAPEEYGKVKYELEQMIDDLKLRQISLRFVPTILELDEKLLTTEISGYLTSYVGIKQTEHRLVKYKLGFAYRGGRLMLIEFRELVKDMIR